MPVYKDKIYSTCSLQVCLIFIVSVTVCLLQFCYHLCVTTTCWLCVASVLLVSAWNLGNGARYSMCAYKRKCKIICCIILHVLIFLYVCSLTDYCPLLWFCAYSLFLHSGQMKGQIRSKIPNLSFIMIFSTRFILVGIIKDPQVHPKKHILDEKTVHYGMHKGVLHLSC